MSDKSYFTSLMALAFTFVAGSASAALLDVPPGLAPELEGKLLQQHAELQHRQSVLKGEVDKQNSDCSAVPDDSPQAADCAESQSRIQTEVDQYTRDETAFNQRVKAAVAESPEEHDSVYHAKIRSVQYIGSFKVIDADGNQYDGENATKFELSAGAELITGPGSRASVTFPDGEIIQMQSNGIFKVDRFRINSAKDWRDIEISIKQGILRYKSGFPEGSENHGSFRFSIPGSSVLGAVRGTDIEVSTTKGGNGYVKLFRGSLDISVANSNLTLTLKPGEMIRFDAKGPIGGVIPIPAG